MTMQTLVDGVHYGVLPAVFGLAGVPSASDLLMDASGEGVWWVFEAPETASITKIGFFTGTVTTSESLDVGVYDVSATTGLPTSLVAGSAVGTQATVASNTAYTVALGTAASLTKGTIYALGITFTSWSAGNLNIAGLGGSSNVNRGFPYAVNPTAANIRVPHMWVEWTGGLYYYLADLIPASADVTALGFNTGSANDEIGMVFTVPFKARVAGIAGYFGGGNNATFSINLYEGTTLKASTTYGEDLHAVASGRFHLCRFVTPFEIAANTAYRIGVRALNANSVVVYYFTAPSSAALDQVGGGSAFYYTHRDNGGAWTGDDTASRPWIWVVFDQIDDGAGGGGGGMLVHPGMTGGMNG